MFFPAFVIQLFGLLPDSAWSIISDFYLSILKKNQQTDLLSFYVLFPVHTTGMCRNLSIFCCQIPGNNAIIIETADSCKERMNILWQKKKK